MPQHIFGYAIVQMAPEPLVIKAFNSKNKWQRISNANNDMSDLYNLPEQETPHKID
jgi:hypothetical protein